MEISKKIALLQRLLDQAGEFKACDSDEPAFKTWKNTVERTLIRVFGKDSPELEQFHRLCFFYNPSISWIGADHSRKHRECFERDYDILISLIKNCIEELQLYRKDEGDEAPEESSSDIKRVFISHSSKDAPFVEELVDLLGSIGLLDESIFCTSFPGYGIDLGENFLETIKDELHRDTLVLFVLSKTSMRVPYVCVKWARLGC